MARPSISSLILVAVLTLVACRSGGSGDENGSAGATRAPDTTGVSTDQPAADTTSPSGTDDPAQDDSAGGDTGGGGGGDDTGGGDNGGAGGTGQGGGGDTGFDYVPIGPDDPPIPSNYTALAASSSQLPDCDELDGSIPPDDDFWEFAVRVCRAIVGQGPPPQETSAPTPPRADDGSEFLACLDDEVHAMLERAARWYADHPGQQPVVRYPEHSSRSPCQLRIWDTVVLEPDEPDDYEGIVPVWIAFATTNKDISVSVDGEAVEDTDNGDFSNLPGLDTGLQRLIALVPRGSETRTATIDVTIGAFTLSTQVDIEAGEATTDETDDTVGTDNTVDQGTDDTVGEGTDDTVPPDDTEPGDDTVPPDGETSTD